MNAVKTDSDVVLETRNLVKSFGGLTAVSDFDMSLKKGELVGLIGPNGAGKTTNFNLLSGVFKPDSGQIIFKGEDITGLGTHEISKRGLVRSFQDVRLMSGLTVVENLRHAFHNQIDYTLIDALFHDSSYREQEENMYSRIHEVLEQVGIDQHAESVVDDLPYGVQRKVGLARSLCLNPTTLLLDEPTAGLNPRETDEIVDLIQDLWSDLGLTVVIVEHNMRVIMNISERIIVMNQGKVLTKGTPEEVQNDPDVVKVYLGTETETSEGHEKEEGE